MGISRKRALNKGANHVSQSGEQGHESVKMEARNQKNSE